MKSAVVDFETYYAPDYTLSKMTTEAYVRDARFETILCGFRIGRAPAYWVPGPEVGAEITRLKLENYAVIAHHAHFDGLILSHHYDTVPGYWIDTLSMARAVYGSKIKKSLKALSELEGIGQKGTEVELAFGKRFRDFSKRDLASYGAYCCNDCDLEYELAKILSKHFQRSELDLIDSTIRLFTEPILQLNRPLLEQYAIDLRIRKASLLMEANVQLADIMSNDKFAESLRFLGIDPPMKISPTTGKPTYAFAKTDPAMQELAEHEDETVQALIAARLNARSTINESRTQRLLAMEKNGSACVYLNYYGAGQTGRASGGDMLNWQNFARGGKIRESVLAPPGHELVVGDSSNIESRLEDWLAGQDDQVEAYRIFDRGEGPDIYCVMAQKIYGRVISKEADPKERFVGKTAKLGLGYGTGAAKFAVTTKLPLKDAQNIVNIYRNSYKRVVALWNRCDEALGLVAKGIVGRNVDFRGIITTVEGGLLLPNGLVIKYTDLKWNARVVTKKGKVIDYEGWSYFDGRSRQNIYGAKVVENIVQALARIVVLTQTLMVPRRLVLSVHDEGVWCVPLWEVLQTAYEVNWALRQPLPWCPDLPLNCEVGSHRSYGKAKP